VKQAFAAFLLGSLLGFALPACAGGNLHQDRDMGAVPVTRAERTNFAETSRYADVVAFFDALKKRGAPVHVASMGKTADGRGIVYVVASRPPVHTAAQAKKLGRPVVYVQANIHGGEVEGKEALLALVRDLTLESAPNVLDSLVLVAVPNYNADGNEKLASQEQNRPAQNGPPLVGERSNGLGIDLNRDYVKAESPETRAALAMWQNWDPDVFVDLHTTDGSLHGYALTYSPSLSPAAMTTDAFTREKLLPSVRARMRAAHGLEVFDYGNFVRQNAEVLAYDSESAAGIAWATYDSRPRFGTNYYGLRGRIAVLAEAYSHDPFRRRVSSTYHFVREVLSYVAENAGAVSSSSRKADEQVRRWAEEPDQSPFIGLRARLTSEPKESEVLVELVEPTGSDVRTEPGLLPGMRRTGKFHPVRMPVLDRFEATLSRKLPYAYAFSSDVREAIVPLLERHGIVVERLEKAAEVTLQSFVVESAEPAARAFQNHHETTLHGHWGIEQTRAFAAGTFIVRAGQPLGILAMYLLEPESDDGLVTWNFLDRWLLAGREYPLVRVVSALPAGAVHE
jgi:zinc carboxypeptidase